MFERLGDAGRSASSEASAYDNRARQTGCINAFHAEVVANVIWFVDIIANQATRESIGSEAAGTQCEQAPRHSNYNNF